MPHQDLTNDTLDEEQVRHFIQEGFTRIDNAFPRELAEAAQAILWRDTRCDPKRPETWTQPVVRLGMYTHGPFTEAAKTARLRAAYDRLVGPGRWHPCTAMGTFPVRFPSPDDPGDTGWHVDMSFDWEKPDFLDWRVNASSRGRALLMLFLFSDIGEDDAPTRLRLGSHLDVARMLAPAGEAGMTLREIAARLGETEGRPEALATGEAGTVYLCHPFLVHSAQMHRGSKPRFMAQPPLFPRMPLQLVREDGAYSPVEEAIRIALHSSGKPIEGRSAHSGGTALS